jgi:hypothetical protein
MLILVLAYTFTVFDVSYIGSLDFDYEEEAGAVLRMFSEDKFSSEGSSDDDESGGIDGRNLNNT